MPALHTSRMALAVRRGVVRKGGGRGLLRGEPVYELGKGSHMLRPTLDHNSPRKGV